MAEEAVIFPSQPLFMVDRGWQRHQKRSKKSIPSGETDLQTSRVPEVTIRVMNGPANVTAKSPFAEGDKKPPKGKRTKTPIQLQFMNYEPLDTEKKQHVRQKKRVKARVHPKQEPTTEASVAASTKPWEWRTNSPTLKH